MNGGSLHVKLHCEKHKDVESGCDHHFSFRPHTVAKHLMPRAFFPHERQTLVMSRTQSGLSSLKMTARQLVQTLIWTSGPPEGFAATELFHMVTPQVVSRSSMYEALRWGVDQKYLRITGTERRSRWTTGEVRPPWLPDND